MALKRTYTSETDIPEAERALYVEQGDLWVLDVEGGFKSEADVSRLDAALKKEREAHKQTKAKITAFGDLTPEALQAIRDENEDLKLQVEAGAKPDEKVLEPLIARRVQTALRPVERERDQLKAEIEKTRGEAETLRASDRKRRLQDTIRAATAGEKGVKLRAPSVLEDVELLAERIFEEVEGGGFAVREGVGFSVGSAPADWLRDLQAAGTRPHWFPENEGAGANRSDGRKGAGANPLKGDKPNMTEFGKLVRSNPQLAVRYAREAGKTNLLPQHLRPTKAA